MEDRDAETKLLPLLRIRALLVLVLVMIILYVYCTGRGGEVNCESRVTRLES